jgi:hypothetical protein
MSSTGKGKEWVTGWQMADGIPGQNEQCQNSAQHNDDTSSKAMMDSIPQKKSIFLPTPSGFTMSAPK